MKAYQHNPPLATPTRPTVQKHQISEGRKDQTFQASQHSRTPYLRPKSDTEGVRVPPTVAAEAGSAGLISPQLKTIRALLPDPTGETLDFHGQQLEPPASKAAAALESFIRRGRRTTDRTASRPVKGPTEEFTGRTDSTSSYVIRTCLFVRTHSVGTGGRTETSSRPESGGWVPRVFQN